MRFPPNLALSRARGGSIQARKEALVILSQDLKARHKRGQNCHDAAIGDYAQPPPDTSLQLENHLAFIRRHPNQDVPVTPADRHHLVQLMRR